MFILALQNANQLAISSAMNKTLLFAVLLASASLVRGQTGSLGQMIPCGGQTIYVPGGNSNPDYFSVLSECNQLELDYQYQRQQEQNSGRNWFWPGHKADSDWFWPID